MSFAHLGASLPLKLKESASSIATSLDTVDAKERLQWGWNNTRAATGDLYKALSHICARLIFQRGRCSLTGF